MSLAGCLYACVSLFIIICRRVHKGFKVCVLLFKFSILYNYVCLRLFFCLCVCVCVCVCPQVCVNVGAFVLVVVHVKTNLTYTMIQRCNTCKVCD